MRGLGRVGQPPALALSPGAVEVTAAFQFAPRLWATPGGAYDRFVQGCNAAPY